MILLFPTLDTFRLTLTSGIVPADMSLQPATVSTDEAGRLFVETDAKLTKKAKDDLDKLKVLGAKRHGGPTEAVSSWLQVVPLSKDAGPIHVTAQAPVLFELPSPELLPTVVGEMLRLGNDRQSFRFLSVGGSDRVLLRVIGPPYYTLLRAIDHRSAGGEPVRAYTEAAPRVWVEVGFSHPFAKQIKPADGQQLLLQPPRTWAYLPDGPFQDVYDILNFTLPSKPTGWTEKAVKSKLTVPLKLTAGNAADVPELWVIRGQGVAALDALVRDADDRLMGELTFAIGKSPTGEETVVLRTRPSRKQPPVLALDNAVPYKSYWRIPNLFLPVGRRLHPTIRRDVVTKLLADDRDRLVWLTPGENGSFSPETLPEDAFRPLPDWVEYVVDTNRTDLKQWIEATEFDFDAFVCADSPPKPKTPPGEKAPKDRSQRDDEMDDTTGKPAKPTGTKQGAKKGATAEVTFDVPVLEKRPPSEWKIRCDELEKQFTSLDGPLDMPERVALWPELAVANSALGDDRKSEAAVCWVNCLWADREPNPSALFGWSKAETPTGKTPPTAAELDARMKVASPTPGEMRAFVSGFLAVAVDPPDWLKSRLAAVQKFLDQHDEKVPIRGAWLAAVRLAQLSGADVLGLARVRDRLLNRLLERGLSPEADLPGFLRYSGLKDSDRVRQVREKAVEVHTAARAWADKSLKPTGTVTGGNDSNASLAYLDLMFAYGLAKLGETSAASRLQEAVKKVLVATTPTDTKSIVGGYLFKAFNYRIADAVAGRPHAGLLSAELLDELDGIQKKGGSGANDPHKMAHYIIARMREQSRIVDPMEKNDPYAEWMKHGDELKKELAELPKIKEPKQLERKIRDLYKDGAKGKVTTESKFLVLHDALPHAPKVGQDFTVELLKLVPGVLKATPASGPTAAGETLKKQGQLLERSLFLAGHFDKTDLVQVLVDQFIEYVRAKSDEQRFELVNVVAGQCLRSLRKVGLRDEIDKLLRRMQDEILKGKTLAQLKTQYASKPDVWADALQTQLNLAAGWLTFGLTDQAATILETARAEILAGSKLTPQKFTRLCQTYVAALGQGPADLGMPRLVELFKSLPPDRITNTFTTAPYYSRLHLNLIEEVVLAIVSDDFALGQAGKRWLDEDEHLVRRRIHQDMRELVAKTGV